MQNHYYYKSKRYTQLQITMMDTLLPNLFSLTQMHRILPGPSIGADVVVGQSHRCYLYCCGRCCLCRGCLTLGSPHLSWVVSVVVNVARTWVHHMVLSPPLAGPRLSICLLGCFRGQWVDSISIGWFSVGAGLFLWIRGRFRVFLRPVGGLWSRLMSWSQLWGRGWREVTHI